MNKLYKTFSYAWWLFRKIVEKLTDILDQIY